MASRLSPAAREPQAQEWMSLQRAALRYGVSGDTLRHRSSGRGTTGIATRQEARPGPCGRSRCTPCGPFPARSERSDVSARQAKVLAESPHPFRK